MKPVGPESVWGWLRLRSIRCSVAWVKPGAAIAAAALLMVTLSGRGASAAPALERYVVTFKPHASYNVELRLSYADPVQPKKAGFKFLGDESIRAFRARDAEGRPVEIRQGTGYREERLDWSVPGPDPTTGLQTVHVELRQDQPARYAWNEKRVSIPWAHEFKIPVREMTFAVALPSPEWSLPGYECETTEAHSTCSVTKGEPFPIRDVTIDAVDELPGLVVASLIALAAALLSALALRRARAELLEEKGVTPPAEDRPLADFPTTYRAQPPVQEHTEPSVVVPAEDRIEFRKRVGLAAFVFAGPAVTVATLANGRSPVPMSWLLTGTLLASGVVLWGLLRKKGGR